MSVWVSLPFWKEATLAGGKTSIKAYQVVKILAYLTYLRWCFGHSESNIIGLKNQIQIQVFLWCGSLDKQNNLLFMHEMLMKTKAWNFRASYLTFPCKLNQINSSAIIPESATKQITLSILILNSSQILKCLFTYFKVTCVVHVLTKSFWSFGNFREKKTLNVWKKLYFLYVRIRLISDKC